ncbi:para-aminobenzoate synthase, (PABA) [Spiromyces aspiralis]|uniref:Para-aminobenzoate synthase, (PABA) n=1 Tax=Spiromyces aspiralis TaxID=68401 RepID=A0ACC1HI30_9FUNG|nr:para-aminobenzoate synthase, (PABA) [Spiromyces aspiralis]
MSPLTSPAASSNALAVPDPTELALKRLQESMRTLIVDNYDSYTYNLLHLWFKRPHLPDARPLDDRVILIRNDQYPWEIVRDRILPFVDNIIISPGPGTPEIASDFGVCANILREVRDKPIFGVCLGHQGIAHIFGGKVVKARAAVHGQLSPVKYKHGFKTVSEANTVVGKEGTLFEGIPENLRVVRYHSLVADPESLAGIDDLLITAYAVGTVRVRDPTTGQFHNEATTEIMALQHRTLPIYGVQFHPESICTEYGRQLMTNFHRLTAEYLTANGLVERRPAGIPSDVLAMSALASTSIASPAASGAPELRLVTAKLPALECNPADLTLFLFEWLYGDDQMGFMLDSAKLGDLNSTYSIMGSGLSAGSVTVRYRLADNRAQILAFDPSGYAPAGVERRVVHEEKLHPDTLKPGTTFWDWMQTVVNQTQADDQIQLFDLGRAGWLEDYRYVDELPFAFRGGWVGHFTYEMKAESLPMYSTQSRPHGSSGDGVHPANNSGGDASAELPDVNLIFADRSIVVRYLPDASGAEVYIQALVRSSTFDSSEAPQWFGHIADTSDTTMEWLGSTARSISQALVEFAHGGAKRADNSDNGAASNTQAVIDEIADPVSALSYAEYIAAVEQSQKWIREGESYEVCLTTQFRVDLTNPLKAGSPLAAASNGPLTAEIRDPATMRKLYRSLRRFNPAPYAAYFWFGDIGGGIAGSSPERFLRVTTNLNIKSMDSELIDTDEAIWNEHQSIPTETKGRRWVEMKPIKGTVRRPKIPSPCPHGTMLSPVCDHCEARVKAADKQLANELYHDVKERAENLMIVDLIRNDLTTFCGPNTVCVPHLMAIETYAHVHQMVTTVCGELRDEVGGLKALDRCFPPGSMTGAPKLRTVQLLEYLETERRKGEEEEKRVPYPRGIYSGCIGYISAHGGQADWSVVIRTVVVDHHGKRLSAGAGGALTILSDPHKEWEEVLVKFGSVYPGIKSYIAERIAEQF